MSRIPVKNGACGMVFWLVTFLCEALFWCALQSFGSKFMTQWVEEEQKFIWRTYLTKIHSEELTEVAPLPFSKPRIRSGL